MDQTLKPRVEIAQGTLEGVVRDGVCRFNGIPYAKPPVGALRWQLPEPPEAWSGVRDATYFGNIAPQVPSAAGEVLGGTAGTLSEDCLYLNIQTPACDDGKRAVMVWIHGGAFVTGAGSIGTYNGKYLVPRGDVVLVTINYRLGALGFLNLHDASGGKLPGSGAEGLADQVAALRWVKQNIAAFGGDADNITIFGESAGGMSVGALLGMPSAKGLFHKAIPQSGASDVGFPRETSSRVAAYLLSQLGAGDPRELPFETILDVQRAMLAKPPRELGVPMAFTPTADGNVLPVRAIETVRGGSAAGIPVMTGTTRDEWNLFTIAAPNIKKLDDAGLRTMTARLIGEECADGVLGAYTGGSAFDRWNDLNTDKMFFVPATRLLEAQAAHGPAFAYRFDWPSPMKGLGACHALELGFVFGTWRIKAAQPFFGSGPNAEQLSGDMMDAWIRFAKTGNPGWDGYDSATRTTMIFGDGAPHAADAPNESRRKAWEQVPAERIGA